MLQTLLHRGMSELLRTATASSFEEPWPRVHAFNVLRLAFNDKNLAVDSSGFFAEGAAPCADLTERAPLQVVREICNAQGCQAPIASGNVRMVHGGSASSAHGLSWPCMWLCTRALMVGTCVWMMSTQHGMAPQVLQRQLQE